MKKILAVLLSVCLCVLVLVPNVTETDVAYAAYETKTVSGFYRSDFVMGVADIGMNVLVQKRAYSIRQKKADANIGNVLDAMLDNTVVLIHSHGAPGLITLSSTQSLTATQISVVTTRTFGAHIVYLSACQTGAASTSSNLCQAIVNKGAKVVIAFTENISAITGTDGIHRFNELVITYLHQGETVDGAVAHAQRTIIEESGKTWGSESCVIYGNKNYTLQ